MTHADAPRLAVDLDAQLAAGAGGGSGRHGWLADSVGRGQPTSQRALGIGGGGGGAGGFLTGRGTATAAIALARAQVVPLPGQTPPGSARRCHTITTVRRARSR